MELFLRVSVKPDEAGIPGLYLIARGVKQEIAIKYRDEIMVGEIFRMFKESVCVNQADQAIATPIKKPIEAPAPRAKGAGIEARDVVICVSSNPRENEIERPIVGQEYTVMSVVKAHNAEGKIIKLYEVLSQQIGRIHVFEDEIEYVRTNPPAPQVDRSFKEEVVVCEQCGETNSVMKRAGEDCFTGECTQCGKVLKLTTYPKPVAT